MYSLLHCNLPLYLSLLAFVWWSSVEFLHVKPGKGAAFVRTKMRNYLTGNTVEKTFRAGSTVMSTELEVRCSFIVLHVNHTICQQVNCICSIPTNLLSSSTVCWQFTLRPNHLLSTACGILQFSWLLKYDVV